MELKQDIIVTAIKHNLQTVHNSELIFLKTWYLEQ